MSDDLEEARKAYADALAAAKALAEIAYHLHRRAAYEGRTPELTAAIDAADAAAAAADFTLKVADSDLWYAKRGMKPPARS